MTFSYGTCKLSTVIKLTKAISFFIYYYTHTLFKTITLISVPISRTLTPFSRPKKAFMCSLYTLFQTKIFKNHTLSSGTYVYSRYRRAPPLRQYPGGTSVTLQWTSILSRGSRSILLIASRFLDLTRFKLGLCGIDLNFFYLFTHVHVCVQL